MNLDFRGIRPEEGSPTQEAVASIRYAAGQPASEPQPTPPALVAYTPVARMNPFQSLIYQRFFEHGLATSPVFDEESFPALQSLQNQTGDVIIHFHWLNTILAGAKSRHEAESRAGEFLDKVSRFRDRGGRIAWTVHNMAPHDAVYLDAEHRLQQGVADRSDLIHVMSEDTPDLLSGILSLPADRTAVVPHPSYLGAYPDHVTRDTARVTLGLAPDEIVYLAFGAIKAYKGLEQLLDGFSALQRRSRTPRRLIVAGNPDNAPATKKLVKALRAHPYVLLLDRKVAVDEVQYLMRAADVTVLSHQVALNSGAALLGPSFGRPLLANRVGVLPNFLDDSFAEFMAGSDADGVAEGLHQADRLLADTAGEAAGAFATRHQPQEISRQLAQAFQRHALTHG